MRKLLGAVAAMTVFVGTASQSQPMMGEAQARANLKATQERVLMQQNAAIEARDVMVSKLKNPEGAQFRKVSLFQDARSTFVICGEVNFKDESGKYSGFTRFIASKETGVVETGELIDFVAMRWHFLCAPTESVRYLRGINFDWQPGPGI